METIKEKPVHCRKCAVTYALNILGGKWRLPIIWQLSTQESMRYNELKRHLEGITNIMLTRALQDLEIINEWGKEKMRKYKDAAEEDIKIRHDKVKLT